MEGRRLGVREGGREVGREVGSVGVEEEGVRYGGSGDLIGRGEEIWPGKGEGDFRGRGDGDFPRSTCTATSAVSNLTGVNLLNFSMLADLVMLCLVS